MEKFPLNTELFVNLAESMAQLVWVTDLEGQVLYINTRWFEFTGQKKEELDGSRKIWQSITHPDDLPGVREKHLQALHNGTPFEIEYRLRRADGEYRWHLARTVVVKDAEGNPKWRVGTATEIHDQRRLLEENARLYTEAKNSIQLRDEFLSIASHELKTPVTSLKLFVDLIRRTGPTPERMNKFVDLCDRTVKRLIVLIEDMLDITRIQSGRVHLSIEAFDYKALLEEIMERFAPQFEENKIEISTAIGPIHAYADVHRLDQIITNLIMNAVRYAPGAPLRVSLSSENGNIRLMVKDHGPGIAKEHQQKVFDRFERLVPGNEKSGLGLGLYIARELARAHGGELSLDSNPGEGASFSLDLPVHVSPPGYGKAIE